MQGMTHKRKASLGLTHFLSSMLGKDADGFWELSPPTSRKHSLPPKSFQSFSERLSVIPGSSVCVFNVLNSFRR